MAEETELPKYPLALLGYEGVGKLTYVLRIILDHWVDEFDPMICDTYHKELTVDGERLVVNMLDPAGGEDYDLFKEVVYWSETKGFIFCYSTTNRHTFNDMKDLHSPIKGRKGTVEDFKDHLANNLRDSEGRMKTEVDQTRLVKYPMVIMATKSDQKVEREVSEAEGWALAEEWGCEYFETSAKTNDNLEAPIHNVVRRIREFYTGQTLEHLQTKPPEGAPKTKNRRSVRASFMKLYGSGT